MYMQQADSFSMKSFMYRVFGWMTAALGITTVIAYSIAQRPEWMQIIFSKPLYFFAIVIAQLITAFSFALLLPRLSYATALALFLLYSILTGLTLSVVFYQYHMLSIVQALIITAGMFASMALYGYFTQADLSNLGSILRMALWGIILALIINIFMHNPMFDLVISWVCVVVFSALTFYDVAMIKRLAQAMESRGEGNAKIGLFGAFMLYLDFINLFLAILNISGKRKE